MNPLVEKILVPFAYFTVTVSVLFFLGAKLLEITYSRNSKYSIVREYDGVTVCQPLSRKEAKIEFSKLCRNYEKWAFEELRYKHESQAQLYFDWRNSLKLVKHVEEKTPSK